MKKLLFLLAFISIAAQAQFKIEGTMKPAENFSWVILYKIEGARQIFVKSGKITNGKFNFELPTNTDIGMYRVSYKTQGSGFVDFLFNKEDVAFTFNPNEAEQTIAFQKSEENKLYQEYITIVSSEQYKADSLQVAYLRNNAPKTIDLYKNQLKKIASLQASYLKKTDGKLVNNFVKATNRYNSPTIAKTQQEYLNGIIDHFFDTIDFNNKALYNSTFLVDRITDYVFYMNYSEDPKKQLELHKKSVDVVLGKTNDPTFKKDILEYLITLFINYKKVDFSDYLFATYYDKLPKNIQDAKFKKDAMEKTAVAIGRTAPEITWSENGKNYKLSTINEAKNYVLVFWSTSCSHCTREIPLLHTFTKGIKNTKVIAFGMEEGEKDWKNYVKNITGWHHILGLNKWENEIPRTYQIYETPTYIILDSNKKIIAKPETLEEVKNILKYLE